MSDAPPLLPKGDKFLSFVCQCDLNYLLYEKCLSHYILSEMLTIVTDFRS